MYYQALHGHAITISYFSQETCNDSLNITMCPLCDGVCDYWHLSTVCSLARASYLFDNGATVLFAIFMSLWGTCILYISVQRTYLRKSGMLVTSYRGVMSCLCTTHCNNVASVYGVRCFSRLVLVLTSLFNPL